jgi:hypothetical protein
MGGDNPQIEDRELFIEQAFENLARRTTGILHRQDPRRPQAGGGQFLNCRI